MREECIEYSPKNLYLFVYFNLQFANICTYNIKGTGQDILANFLEKHG